MEKMLEKLQYTQPLKSQHAPHEWSQLVYSRNPQLDPPTNTSPPLTPTEATRIQRIVGWLLYYGWAVDPTIYQQSINWEWYKQVLQKTAEKSNRLLDYLSSHSTAKLRYYSSDMCLHVDIDILYLVAPKYRSMIAGYLYLGKYHNDRTNPNTKLNAAIHVECKLLKNVVSSAVEAETCGIYTNCQVVIPLRYILQVLGHLKPSTPVKTHISIASTHSNDTLTTKRSKSWDMIYY